MSLEIRTPLPDDRDAWGALFRAYGVFYETEFSDAVLDGVWAWIQDPDHELSCLLAVGEAGPLGLAHVRRQADTFTAGPGWYLDDLYVAPESRGSGAGEALIREAQRRAHAAGGGTLRWITAADNARAQRLYDRVATRTTWVTYELET